VEVYIFTYNVSNKKKQEIKNNANMAQGFLGNVSSVSYIDERGLFLRDIGESSYRTGVAKANLMYRQLYVAQIIRYWVEIHRGLQYKAFNNRQQDIPFFSEVLALYYNDDRYLKTRKNFERLR